VISDPRLDRSLRFASSNVKFIANFREYASGIKEFVYKESYARAFARDIILFSFISPCNRDATALYRFYLITRSQT